MWIALATFVVGLVIGYENNKIRNQVSEIKHSLMEEKTKPTVVSGDPRFVQEERLEDKDSAVVLPDSPQLVEWKENQELERLNRTGRPR